MWAEGLIHFLIMFCFLRIRSFIIPLCPRIHHSCLLLKIHHSVHTTSLERLEDKKKDLPTLRKVKATHLYLISIQTLTIPLGCSVSPYAYPPLPLLYIVFRSVNYSPLLYIYKRVKISYSSRVKGVSESVSEPLFLFVPVLYFPWE